MVKMQIEYIGDLRCKAVHGPSGSMVETDAPADNQGKAERFSPTDLCGVSLATCMATTLAIKGKPKGWRLESMKVEVQKQMSSEGSRRIVRLPVEVWMPADFPAQDRAEAEQIARNCPALLSLHPSIDIPIVFHW